MFKKVLLTTSLLLTPFVVSAQIADGPDAGPFQDLLINILTFTNDVLIPFIIGLGFLFFVWGMFKYFIMGGANDEAKEQGKSLLIFSTLGFVMIIIFWGVVNLLTESTGLSDMQLQNIPNADLIETDE